MHTEPGAYRVGARLRQASTPPRVCLAFAVAALAACAPQPAQPPMAARPDAVVPGIASQFSTCDLDALMANYAANVEFVSPSTPTPLVGLVALRAHFAGACTGTVRAVMKVETQTVRLLSSDAAVVTGTYSFGRTDRPNATPWPASFVITLARGNGRWLVTTQATFAIPGS